MANVLKNSNGDTIVEVMLATVIMSVVLVSAYNLSNQANIINQDSIERTQIVNYLQAQAEYLRVARSQGGTAWEDAGLRGVGVNTDPTSPTACRDADLSGAATFANPDSYHMQLAGGNAVLIDGAQGPLDGAGYYVWIDTVGNPGGSHNTFVINACWPALSKKINFQSGVVVRMEAS